MLTAQRIQQVALAHFAQHGYSGASLAQIAEEVGIKKPSIYAHYKGKDDLFLQVIENVFRDELGLLIGYLEQHSHLPLEQRLLGILQFYQGRYEQTDTMKFMLRMSFYPPKAMHEQVMRHLYAYLDDLEQQLVSTIARAVEAGEIRNTHPEHAANAFLCLMDGVIVELIYGGTKRYMKRLEAAWPFFWHNLAL